MKIESEFFVNGRFLFTSHPTGTHRSSYGICKALMNIAKCKLKIIIPSGANRGFTNLFDQISENHGASGNSKLGLHFWEQFILPFSVKSKLILNPLGTAPFIFNCSNQIIIIHDLNAVKLKGNYGRIFPLLQYFECVVAGRRAKHIICFTEIVKEDIVNVLKVSPKKVSVIPQGPGLPSHTYKGSYKVDTPYFLCVGGFQKHKNLKNILIGWKKKGLAEKNWKLIVAGKKQDNFADDPEMGELLKMKGVVQTGFISDQQLCDLYRSSIGLVYPSFSEGFGLPLVEAFNLDCPVITSNVSCLPEVAGDAAILVDPTSPAEIAAAMIKLGESEELRKTLISKGKIRKEHYSWPNAGKELCRVINSVLNENTTNL